MKFSDRLRQLREDAGLTQTALADASGVPIGSIRNYEQGHREPLWDTAFKLARALGVGVEAFAVEDEPAPKKTKLAGGT